MKKNLLFKFFALKSYAAMFILLTSALSSYSASVTITCTGTAGSYNSGTITNAGTKTDGNMVQLKSSSPNPKGWATFDLSAIPSGSTVTAVTATFYVYSTTTSVTSNSVYGFLGDAATLSGSALFSAIPTSGDYNTSTWSPTTTNSKVLNAAGITFINTNQGTKVNLAYVRKDTNPLNIYGYPGTAAQQPTLVVTYTPCGAAPITNVSPSGQFCDQTTLVATGGAGGTVYYQGTTNNGTSTAVPASSQVVSASGTYYFRSYNGTCWGPQGSTTVTKVVTPTGGSVTSVDSICSGASNIAYSISGVVGTVSSYSWTVPSPGAIVSGQTTTNISVNWGTFTSGNTYTVSCYAVNGICVNTPKSKIITIPPVPAQPSVITLPNPICLGLSDNYSVSNVAGLTYSWTMPNAGWTTNGATNASTINITAGSTSGTLSVVAINYCNISGPSRSATVASNLPVPKTPGPIVSY